MFDIVSVRCSGVFYGVCSFLASLLFLSGVRFLVFSLLLIRLLQLEFSFVIGFTQKKKLECVYYLQFTV